MADWLQNRVLALSGLLRVSGRIIIAAPLLIAVLGCSDGEATRDETAEALASSSEEFAGEGYTEFDERRDAYQGSRGSFEEYGCTEDCSGHEAGYVWAEEKGITDPDDCGGKSWSFIEGCRAFAEQASESESAEGE